MFDIFLVISILFVPNEIVSSWKDFLSENTWQTRIFFLERFPISYFLFKSQLFTPLQHTIPLWTFAILFQRLAPLSRALFIRYYLRLLASNDTDIFPELSSNSFPGHQNFKGFTGETHCTGNCVRPRRDFCPSPCTCQDVSLSSICPWLSCKDVLERFPGGRAAKSR